MSYTPTQWKDGDLVTSAKLNKMEQGIAAGGGILIVNIVQENDSAPPVLDRIWQEIHDADICYCIRHNENQSLSFPILSTVQTTGKESEYEYHVYLMTFMGPMVAVALSANDYPILEGTIDDNDETDENPGGGLR